MQDKQQKHTGAVSPDGLEAAAAGSGGFSALAASGLVSGSAVAVTDIAHLQKQLHQGLCL